MIYIMGHWTRDKRSFTALFYGDLVSNDTFHHANMAPATVAKLVASGRPAVVPTKDADHDREGALIATSVLTAAFGIGFFVLLGVLVHSRRRATSKSSPASAGGVARPSLGGVLKSMGIERRQIPACRKFAWTATR